LTTFLNNSNTESNKIFQAFQAGVAKITVIYGTTMCRTINLLWPCARSC